MLNVEKRWLLKVVLLVLLADLFGLGCAKLPLIGGLFKKKQPPQSVVYPSETNLPPPPGVEAGKATGVVSPLPLEGPTDTGIPAAPAIRESAQPSAELQTVYFDFDSAELTDQAKATLDQNTIWLTQNPGVHVLIEGHCDERGTVEYNLNLGQRRADSVREYLVSKNLDPATLHTISYGEERPVDEGHDEAAWAKNRRVQFLVY